MNISSFLLGLLKYLVRGASNDLPWLLAWLFCCCYYCFCYWGIGGQSAAPVSLISGYFSSKYFPNPHAKHMQIAYLQSIILCLGFWQIWRDKWMFLYTFEAWALFSILTTCSMPRAASITFEHVSSWVLGPKSVATWDLCLYLDRYHMQTNFRPSSFE